MDAQTMERLLLDRALGTMPPDTAALLDAYLAEQPAAAAEAERWAATTQLAGLALEGDRESPLPAFPRARLMSAGMRHRRSMLAWRITGLAACWLIGLGMGGLWWRTSRNTPASPDRHAVVMNPEDSTFEAAQESFWSVRRLYERTSTGQVRPSPRVIWQSPLVVPKVGESS